MSISESIICPQCQERAPADYVLCPYCGYSLIKLVRERTRVHVGFTQSMDRIRRLIIDPKHTHETMREISANPDRKGGLMASFLISFFLFEMIAFLFVRSHPADFLSSLNGLLFALGIIIFLPLIGGFFFLFVVYFVWWVFGLATWLLARLVGGKGTRKDTSSIIGYALLPLAPAFLISALIMFLIAPSGGGQSFDATLRDVNADFIAIILLPFLVWSIYLGGLGIQHVHSLDRNFSFGISGFMVAIFYVAFIMNLI
ncbi:MAG: YIP1 family protein [Candidatus Hodarchaeota archaeon]